jgi:hypothetical protein
LKKRAFAAQCEPFILSGFARHEILPQTYAGNSKAGEARKATAGPIIANYVAACSALDGFVTPANQERILLVKGDAGFGKSLLVIERAKSFLKTVRYIGVKLTDRYDVADLLARVVTAVGQPMLPKFATGLRALGGPLQIQISTSFPFGWQDDVKRQLAAGNVGKVAELLECLFQDLSSLPEPLVFILDGFDATAPQMRALIEGQFLAGVARTPSVRAIVAGREIPDPNYAAWADCCAPVCNLTGVSKAEEWMPVVSRLGRRIDAEHPESYLAAICDVLKGQPSKIMEYIQGLPGEN